MTPRHPDPAVAVVVIILTACGVASCGGQGVESTADASGPAEVLVNGHPGQAGGLAWTVPAGWGEEAAGAMRVASYRVPAVSGGGGDADLSISYFPGAGGGEEANIQRWTGQFRAPGGGPPEGIVRGHTRIGAFAVATLDVSGMYQGGPSSRAAVPRAGYRLLAAIVQAPQGPVFFKLTGPSATVAAAREGFDAMLHSIRPVDTD